MIKVYVFLSFFIYSFAISNVGFSKELRGVIAPCGFSNEMAEVRSESLKSFFGDSSIDLFFDESANELTVSWNGDYELNLSVIDFGAFSLLNNCEYAQKAVRAVFDEASVIHTFCNPISNKFYLRGIDIFLKNFQSLTKRFGSNRFDAFDSCMDFVKKPVRFSKDNCTVAAACTEIDGKYAPVYFNKFSCLDRP
jgi:hypothetical protein